MADDDLYVDPPFEPEDPPDLPEEPVLETRNIIDSHGDVIGTLSLPEGTSEARWAAKLALYATAIPATTALQLSQMAVTANMNFGRNVIVMFASENKLMGITREQQTTIRQTMSDVVLGLLLGEIGSVIDSCKAIDVGLYDGVFITATRLLKYVNLCESFLNIQLSTSLEV